jgi:hypothetical protein
VQKRSKKKMAREARRIGEAFKEFLSSPRYELAILMGRELRELAQAEGELAGLLGEAEDRPPRVMVKLRPIYSGIRDVKGLIFDWEPVEGAERYVIRLEDPRTGKKWEAQPKQRPQPYPHEFPCPLEPANPYDWLIVAKNAKGAIIWAERGTFWLLPAEIVEEVDKKLRSLSEKGLMHPWTEGHVLEEQGLFEEALQRYLALTNSERPEEQAWGYIGAITLWRKIYAELVRLNRIALGNAVQEEMLCLEKRLRNLLQTLLPHND